MEQLHNLDPSATIDSTARVSGGIDNSPADSRDLENCLAVFLGRKMSEGHIDGSRPNSATETLREIFDAEEFRACVLAPVLLREPLPHASLGDAPPLRLIDWAQNRLPVSASTRTALGTAGTWSQLLEILLSDPLVIAPSRDLAAAGIDSTLRARLENDPCWTARHAMIGAIDAASAFEVRGWAVDLCDKARTVVLKFFADSSYIGSVSCGDFRADVQDAVGGSGNYGFTYSISAAHRAGFAGGRTLTVVDSQSRKPIGQPVILSSDAAQSWDVIAETRREIAEIRKTLDRIECRLPEVTRSASVPIEGYSEYWERFYAPSSDLLSGQRTHSRQFAYRPLISVVIPTWNSETRWLRKALESVLSQTYDNWEAIISDDASDRDELRSLVRHHAGDDRIRWIEAANHGGIAANTNRAIDAARGDYIAFLDHDDELSPEALYHVILQLQERRFALIYSDEDRIEEDDFGLVVRHTPFFKPDFDHDLLLSMNYICHLVVLRHDILAGIGGLRRGFDGAQDHDLLLRVTDRLHEQEILHLP